MSAGRITRVEIMPLPRWARLALAARCLRRARLVHPSGGDAAVLDGAIDRIESSAAAGIGSEGLTDSAAAAYTLALDNADKPASGGDGDRDVITCMVAHAAAFAAEAATLTDAHQSAHLVAQSVDFVVHAFRMAASAETPAALAAMRADLERLWMAEPTWDDNTPVPPAFFGG